MSKKELEIKLQLLKEIESKMIGYWVGDIGMTNMFTERQLRQMRKQLEEDIKNICDFCTKPCNQPWCSTKKDDKNENKPKCRTCGDCGNCDKK